MQAPSRRLLYVIAVLFPSVRQDVDGRDKCIARTHRRRVFGEMTDTMQHCMDLAAREAIHAVARGVDRGSAA